MTHTSGPPFTVVRLREAYAIDEVDAFLDEIDNELNGSLPNGSLARRIQEARFSPTRIIAGYDMGEVDEYLDELVRRAEAGSITVPKYVPPVVPPTAVSRPNTLTSTRFGGRYSIAEVDSFLAQMDYALAGRLPDESLAQYILEARFAAVLGVGRGYDMRQVDEHMDRLRGWALSGRRPT